MIERSHYLLDGITDADVDEAIAYMKFIQQRTKASIDQIDAELLSSWANAYNTSYIRTAGLGTALTLIDDPEEKQPTPVHLIECKGDRHHMPHNAPFNLIEAWKEWLTEDEEKSSMFPLITIPLTSYIIRYVPIYAPVNEPHKAINRSLLRGATAFATANEELEALFERRDALANQYNAAVFGEIAATIGDNDDGTSQIAG